MGEKRETIVLGGGCFWCLEPLFVDLRGVESAVVGYAGGRTEDPSYELVCTGMTGHAEVVAVKFDPEVISLRELLEVFFSIHDPTTPDRQGADVGSQYRSTILYADNGQKETAEAVISELQGRGLWPKPIVTRVEALTRFHRAEEYHQQYFKKNPFAGYCQMVIRPKVSKFRQSHAGLLDNSGKDPVS